MSLANMGGRGRGGDVKGINLPKYVTCKTPKKLIGPPILWLAQLIMYCARFLDFTARYCHCETGYIEKPGIKNFKLQIESCVSLTIDTFCETMFCKNRQLAASIIGHFGT